MADKSIVVSIRITDTLNKSLVSIADDYNITLSHLCSAVLTSFANEYAKCLVDPDPLADENSSPY